MLAIKLLLTVPVAYLLAYPLVRPESGAGVLDEVARVGSVGAMAIVALFLVLVFLYCRDLQHVLARLRPESRTATPRSVWLMFLIPYNFVEDFFIVHNVARSVQNEKAVHPALKTLPGGGWVAGFGWCAAQIVSLIPTTLGTVGSVIAVPFWVYHWYWVRRAIGLLRS